MTTRYRHRIARIVRQLVMASAVLAATAGGVRAARPDEMLSDKALESRAETLGQDLRCLVCQNQSIEDSDADLAHDLRVLLRQRLVAGDTDAQARQFMVDRYGDFVLLKPPFKAETVLLWLGPVILLLLAGGVAFAFFRRRAASEVAPLTEAERRRLREIVEDDKVA
jgi:cytochrome c-type biogenesis protein CcmH